MRKNIQWAIVCCMVAFFCITRCEGTDLNSTSFDQNFDNIAEQLSEQLKIKFQLWDSSHLQCEEKDDSIVLCDRKIKLVFGGALSGFPLQQIIHKETGRNFISKNQGPWWSLELSGPNGEKKIVDSFTKARCTSFLHKQTVLTYPEDHPIRKWFWRYSLNLVWDELKVPWSKGNIKVTAICTLWNGHDGTARWNISVENHSNDIAVETINFPQISLGCDTTNPDKDIFTTNFGWGQIHPDPLNDESLVRWNHHAYAYPSSVHPLQFHAFYHVDSHKGDGLYLAAYDGAGYTKNFFHRPNKVKKQLDFSMTFYVPDGKIYGSNASIPYDIVSTVFEGDWYDAAQIYREWALRQIWTSKGPLALRKDIPKWFIEHSGGFNLWTKPEATPPTLQLFANILDARPLLFTWYNWTVAIGHKDVPHELPAKGLKDSIKELHDMGYKLLPYLDVRLWDMQTGDWPAYEKYAIQNQNGTIKNEGDPYWKTGFAVMCPSCPPFRNRIAEMAQLIQHIGCDGVYLDQITAGSPVLCYNPNHQHPLGGGTHWVDGIRELLKEIRYRTDTAGKYFVLTSEASAEPWMELIDGNLIHSPILFNNVPIFSAVYGGYTVRYGSGFPVGRDGKKAFVMALGQHFIFGGATSFLSNSKINRLLDKENTDMLEFTNKIGALRQKSLSYLAYGMMKRPLRYRNILPEEVYFRKIPEKEIDPDVPQPHIQERMPAVLNTVWESPDGKTGVIFLNISRSSKEVVFDARDLHPDASPSKKATWITTSSKKAIQAKKHLFSLRIPPLDGGILEFK
jgi:hypothetical protein